MEDKVNLLKLTLEIMRNNLEDFAESFYQNLFQGDSRIKHLFLTTNLTEQKKMLLGIIVLVAENWDKPQLWTKILKNLGARHVKYGARSEDYPLFGAVFLVTLEQYLGPDWTAEVQQAWSDAFGKITQIMLEGAKEGEMMNL